MGDADVAQNIFPNDNTEISLDEALNELDEEMYRLFTFIDMLHTRVSCVMSEIASLKKVRRCFTAFNIFAIPVILAIGLVYTMAGQAISNSIEHGLEKLLMILMYTAMTVGLPFYVSYLWDMCFEGGKEEIFYSNSETENDSSLNEAELTLDDVQESLQRIGQFQTWSQSLYRHNSTTNTVSTQDLVRAEEEQEGKESKLESSDESDKFKMQTPFRLPLTTLPLTTNSAFNNRGIRLAKQQILDLDLEDNNLDTSSTSQNEQDELNVLKIIKGCSPEDMISMNYDIVGTKGVVRKLSRQEVPENTRGRRGVRTIAIQNIGDGSNVAFKKDVGCNTEDTSLFDTTFGL